MTRPPPRWAQLAETLRLPVLGPTSESLGRLRAGRALRAERLAALAVADPGLALEMVRAANARVADSKAPALADGVETVSHGVMLLGVETALELALRLPVVDPARDRDALGTLETLATAHVAGELAAAWAVRGGRRAPEAHRVAAQAYLLGDLAIWCAGDEPAAIFSALERTDPTRGDDAERAILGTTSVEIARTIAGAWRLPMLAREVLDVDAAGTDRGATTALAASLAAATRGGWNPPRLAPLLEALGRRLGVDADQALRIARRDTAVAARGFHAPRLVACARHLPLAPDERVAPDWLVAEPEAAKAARAGAPAVGTPTDSPSRVPTKTPTQAPFAAKAPTGARAEAAAGAGATGPARERADPLARCRAAIQGYASGQLAVHEAMQEMVHGMRTGLAFDRVVLAMLSRDRRQLIGRFSSEPGDQEFLRRFRIDLTDEHLLTGLMRRPQALDVNARNRRAVWAKLPSSARKLLSERGFYLMSLFVRERPVGLFYADWHDTAHAGAGPYEQFKKLCVHTGRALEKAAA